MAAAEEESSSYYSLDDMADLGITVKTTKYSSFVPKLKDDQYEAFIKRSIAENGLYEPIVINQEGDVLDGHRRLRACQETGRPPRFVVKTFEYKAGERLYVRDTNYNRRHMTKYQRFKQGASYGG
jgi:hypothetical protein